MRYFKILPCALVCLLILSFCAACSDKSDQDGASQPGQNLQPQQPQTNQSISDDVYREQLAYYERMVSDLQNEILSLKQQHYVDTFAYKQTIAQLEAQLGALDTDVAAKPEQPTESPEPTPAAVFTYEVKNGTATLTSYVGGAAEVVIPDEIDGYAITAIGDNMFKDTGVVSVTLPASVTSIGWFAFYGCASLQTVTLGDAVTTIGYAAFDGCPKSMTICGVAGSYAEKYAASYGLQFKVQ